MRAKWSAPIRKYWKISEQMMVKLQMLLAAFSNCCWMDKMAKHIIFLMMMKD